jgi:hypothetical protein
MVEHLAATWGCSRVIELNDFGERTVPDYGPETAGLCVVNDAQVRPRIVRNLAQLARRATVTLVACSPPTSSTSADCADHAATQLHELYARLDRRPVFTGWTRSDPSGRRNTAVAIFEGEHVVPLTPAPENFRVLAVMAAFNERDIIVPVVRGLLDQGIEVHVLDNWSDDGTGELLRRCFPSPLLTVERFPARPDGTFALERLLAREEEVAAASGADWAIHHDADEIRRAPWPSVDLRTALRTVQLRGFNAVDHTVVDFRPVDDGFAEGNDPATYFTWCEFGRRPAHFTQIKAWRNQGRVRLTESAGHEAAFEGRRVFPYKFLLRHYPTRSQHQAERKIFAERLGRFSPIERARGWHGQYDVAVPGQSFLREPATLLKFDEGFSSRYLPEVLTGAGIARE